ncbi:hypothetical protein ID866_5789 [Astraeus odoratus]|nr:hypothetical protein ID866_5789 [Astraeus odoratus]
MSRRSNNVRGPTSALTEFLRESGINPALIARRAAIQSAAQHNVQQPAGPSSNSTTDAVNSGDASMQASVTPNVSSSTQTGVVAGTSGYNSDQLDEPEQQSLPKKTRTSKGKTTAATKARAKKKAKEDGDYEGTSEDEYTALSKRMRSLSGTSGSKPPVGSFEKCAKCEKQFTVTKYTIARDPPPGYLCHHCVKSTGIDPFKKPTASRKRKPATEKRDVVNFEERRLPTLATLCIELISKHIEDVEALGDIGLVNMDEISKALAKNRSLTPQNVQLFYDVRNKTLRFYDATHLTPPALTTLTSLSPNLTHLHLDFCGRLTCSVLQDFAKSLPHLVSLALLGPFLSPRFDLACAQQLAQSCTKLEELQLREVGLLDDAFVDPLCTLPPLKSLDLAHPGIGIQEPGWLKLLERHGKTLELFNPSWHIGFTDRALSHGIGKHARLLTELILEGCESLSNEIVSQFFENWRNPHWDTMQASPEDAMDTGYDTPDSRDSFIPNPPLQVLSLARNHELSDSTLTALLGHSGPVLTSLNINGLRSLTSEALASLKCASGLKYLDLSWCREVDDFVMKDIVATMPKLEQVKVWGCSRVKGTGWAGKVRP